jgi:hypothetical protein
MRAGSGGQDGPQVLVQKCSCGVHLRVCSGSAWLRVASCPAWLRVASCLAWLRVASCLAWLRVASCLAWLRVASCRSALASDPGQGVVSWLRVWWEWARGPGQICSASTWLRAVVVLCKAFLAQRETEAQMPMHMGLPRLRSSLGRTGGPRELGQQAGTRACGKANRRDGLWTRVWVEKMLWIAGTKAEQGRA